MKALSMLAAITMASVVAQASSKYERPVDREVKVFIRNAGAIPVILPHARMIAAQMFREIGIRLCWKVGDPEPQDARSRATIVVEISRGATIADLGALAYTYPYSSASKIVVLYDRLERLFRVMPNESASILAHVLVHEITHALQGFSHHTEAGVMKAHWSWDDYRAMAVRPMRFAKEDVDLIRAGAGFLTAGGR